VQPPGEQVETRPLHGDDEGSSVPAATSALVGGQVSEHRIAEMVAELAVGESLGGGLLRPGASSSRAARTLAAGVGVGVVLVAVLGILWLAGSLL
jgi:hypothetical protein